MGDTLSLMHVGAVVPDLDAAIAEHSALGVGPWVTTPATERPTFDGERRSVRRATTRLAFGALPGGGAIELVEPAPDEPDAPLARLLRRGAGVNHIAYWCTTPAAAAAPALAAGATVLTASLTEPDRALPLDVDDRAVLAAAATCYLRLPSGSVVELVGLAVARSLTIAVGPGAEGIVPVPDQAILGDAGGLAGQRGEV